MKYLLLFVIGTILLAYLILKYVNLVQENFENPKIYISMSTIPSRIDFLKPVLESLLNQVIPPSHIYINVPLKYKRFNTPLVIPDWLEKLPTVSLYKIDNDYGPGTKFIGSLMNPLIKPHDLIVITDDDLIKKTHWLETLLRQHDNNRITSFVEKRLGRGIIWGYMGYIFQKKLINLQSLLVFFNNIKNTCFLVDDHWLTGYCNYSNIQIYNIPIKNNNQINQPITNNNSLVNISGSNNRKSVSERCRREIYNKYQTKFPFWCCIGCCNPSKGIQQISQY